MYKELISPILDHLPSEEMHVAARRVLHFGQRSSLGLALLEKFNYRGERFFDNRLNVNLSGVFLDNPVMVGAGWDKVGEAVIGLYALGFSGVEIGSVLADGQPGNPKPRQFVLGPGVVLNRLGFNSPGADVVAKNLSKPWGYRIPTGISIGINKWISPQDAPEAHAAVARRLYPYGSYFAINVSSPNTPGLRALQDKEPLTNIVQAVNEVMSENERKKPLYIKIAPDLTLEAIDDVIQVAIDNRATGIIATNTTNNPDIKGRYGDQWRDEPGGLSGDDPVFRKMSTTAVAHIFEVAGDKLTVIGVGGVKNAETAWEKIAAGATAVQLNTAIRGEGPTVAGRINRGLIELMDQRGVKNISDIVGQEAKKYLS